MTIIRSDSPEVEQVGGLLRVTHGAPSEATPPAALPQSSRVAGQSFALSGGQVAERGVTRYNTATDAPPARGVMATAQRVNGQMTVETVPGVPASRTLITQAVRDGTVRETSPGFFEDVAAVQEAPAAAPASRHASGEDQPFSHVSTEHMAEWNEMIEPLPQAAHDGAVAAALSSITAGDGSMDKAIQRLSAATGMDPAQAAELVETGEAMHRESLTRDLASTGLITREEAPEFYDWCRTHKRLPEAMSALVLSGKTTVFRSLAQEYATRQR